jgi:glycosyltransferase involved in cell wall biosynthesis
MNYEISVALCTYNGSKYLEKQLESIFAQSMPITELVICDDDSTDDTEKIINKFCLLYPSIISFYKNETTLKSLKNFDKAISLAKGDYIFLCDQDDIWNENKVEEMVTFFTLNPAIECVFSDATLINENGEAINNYNLLSCSIFTPALLNKYGSYWNLYSYHENMATGATMAFKKSLKSIISPFPISKNLHHDEWIALICAQRNTLACLNKKLTYYRIHNQQQVGNDLINRFETEQEYIKMVLNMKEPPNFKLYYKIYKRLFIVYEKHHLISKADNIQIINIDALLINDINAITEMRKELNKKYPIQFFIKRLKDKLKNIRQFYKH